MWRRWNLWRQWNLGQRRKWCSQWCKRFGDEHLWSRSSAHGRSRSRQRQCGCFVDDHLPNQSSEHGRSRNRHRRCRCFGDKKDRGRSRQRWRGRFTVKYDRGRNIAQLRGLLGEVAMQKPAEHKRTGNCTHSELAGEDGMCWMTQALRTAMGFSDESPTLIWIRARPGTHHTSRATQLNMMAILVVPHRQEQALLCPFQAMLSAFGCDGAAIKSIGSSACIASFSNWL